MSDADGDAKFLIKNFVMPAIDRLDRKLEQIGTCQIDLKLQDEIIKAKCSSLELQLINLQEDVTQHKKDVRSHYNPYFNETLPEKIWRKKPEIAAGGGLGAALVGLILWLLEHFSA